MDLFALLLKRRKLVKNIISAKMKTFTTAILIAGAIAVQLNEPDPNEGPKRAYYADSVTRSTNPFNFTRLVRNPHSDDWESKFGYQEFPEVFNQ